MDTFNYWPLFIIFIIAWGIPLLISWPKIDMEKMIGSLPKRRIRMIDVVSNSLLLAIFIYFGSLLLSVPFALLVSLFLDIDIVFLMLLLPTAALSITVPILKAGEELTRKFGQVLLMEGAMATIMSIILISTYSGVLQNGFQVKLLLFTVIFVVFVATYWVGKRLMSVCTFKKLLYTLEHAQAKLELGELLLCCSSLS